MTTVRPFNTFGPRQSLRAVIPTIIAQALAGGEIRLGSLQPVRDFTFVTDTARAFIAAAASGERGRGRRSTPGSGRGITIGDLAELILKLAGSDAEIVQEAERVRPEASEVFELVCDATAPARAHRLAPEVGSGKGLERDDRLDAQRRGMPRVHDYTV